MRTRARFLLRKEQREYKACTRESAKEEKDFSTMREQRLLLFLFHFDDENTTEGRISLMEEQIISEGIERQTSRVETTLPRRRRRGKKTVENVRPSGFQRPRAVPKFREIYPTETRQSYRNTEDVYEVEVLKEKVCVWVFSPLEEREKEDFEDIEGVWQKIEREERAVVVRGQRDRVFVFRPEILPRRREGVSEQV